MFYRLLSVICFSILLTGCTKEVSVAEPVNLCVKSYISDDFNVVYDTFGNNYIVSSDGVHKTNMLNLKQSPALDFMYISGDYTLSENLPCQYNSTVTNAFRYITYLSTIGYVVDQVQATPDLCELNVYNDTNKYKVYITQDSMRIYGVDVSGNSIAPIGIKTTIHGE